jgi:hypothetical protein
VPYNLCMSDEHEAPSNPPQYLAILVLAQALEDASNTGWEPSIEDRLDAIEFLRGGWRLELWCDAAGTIPERLQKEAVIVEPTAAELAHNRRVGIGKAREIRALRKEGWQFAEISKRYGIGTQAIGRIVNNRAWREEE